jgi:mannose-6-phosphate isomerase
VDLLECTIMPYAWGSRTAIASLTGRAPSALPEAELWMGAHPVAPSFVVRAEQRQSLDAVIAADPEAELGTSVTRTLGPRLPFLLKVLAAAEPLSLQAHPNAEQASYGWADEERRGVARDAPERSYKDGSHKPELLCALTPFDALSGFREVARTLRLFDELAVTELVGLLAPLRAAPGPSGLAETFRAIMTMPAEARTRAVDATTKACARDGGVFARERRNAVRLAQLYPGDVGVIAALLLELVHLEPGEAIYLGAGNLHAYLEGAGVEIMASSDNVLRGGLTRKHVDLRELLKVLDFGGGPPAIVRPRALDQHESVYDTPAREFRLSRIDLEAGRAPIAREVTGPEILLVADGAADAVADARRATVSIVQGRACFVPAACRSYALSTARPRTTVFRATTNVRPLALDDAAEVT